MQFWPILQHCSNSIALLVLVVSVSSYSISNVSNGKTVFFSGDKHISCLQNMKSELAQEKSFPWEDSKEGVMEISLAIIAATTLST